MKKFLLSTSFIISILLVNLPIFAQDAKECDIEDPNPPQESQAFEHIRDYLNLEPITMPDASEFEAPELEQSLESNVDPVFPGDGSRSPNSTTVYYDLTILNGYTYNSQGLAFSPYIYGSYGNYSSYWQPTTITLPEPATSVTVNAQAFGVHRQWYNSHGHYHYYYYYGIRLIAYNAIGNYIGNTSNFSYGYDNLTFTAPAGEEIAYFVVQPTYSTNYGGYVYVRHIWATYPETNQPPVAIAQDVSVNASANCDAVVTASEIDNGSYDPDGDPITVSVSPAGPYSLGSTPVTLTVSDGDLTSTASATVTVNDVTAPVADLSALADVTGECDATVPSAPTATDNCSGALTGTTSDPLYYDQQGTYTITWTFDDGNGNTTTQTQNVIVDDITAPVITAASGVTTLWPPNHSYETIDVLDIFTGVVDNCVSLSSSDVIISKVTSDEEEDANGGGDGNTTDDIVIASDCKSVDLRKERQGSGNGRVYTIHMQVDDGNGNSGTATYEVHVPKNKNGNAVNDGAVYQVEGNCGSGAKSLMIPTVAYEASLKAYPNPTRNYTTIDVEIPQSGQTSVVVYNSMGAKVSVLFDGYMESGTSEKLVFDGSDLPIGIYYIRLQSGSAYTDTKKLILTK